MNPTPIPTRKMMNHLAGVMEEDLAYGNLEQRSKDRIAVAIQTEEYLSNGGRIKEIAFGESAYNKQARLEPNLDDTEEGIRKQILYRANCLNMTVRAIARMFKMQFQEVENIINECRG